MTVRSSFDQKLRQHGTVSIVMFVLYRGFTACHTTRMSCNDVDESTMSAYSFNLKWFNLLKQCCL